MIFKKIEENKFKLVENKFASQNPDGPDFDSGVPGVWTDSKKVKILIKYLLASLDAGNFDEAHNRVNELSQYHT